MLEVLSLNLIEFHLSYEFCQDLIEMILENCY